MEREQAINRALISISKQIQLSNSQKDVVKDYLNYLYTIGFEHGINRRKSNGKVPVLQLYKGEVIEEYASVSQAARIIGIGRNDLIKALDSPISCKGFHWKRKYPSVIK